MPIKTFDAAKTIGELTNWRLSNLQMQKILYLAHMFYMGKHGGPLLDEEFEAWDYGPVLPSLYHKIKFFGSGPVHDIFYNNRIIKDGPEAEILNQAAQKFAHTKPGTLVAYTHREDGAWSKNYAPGARNMPIKNDDIVREYQSL